MKHRPIYTCTLTFMLLLVAGLMPMSSSANRMMISDGQAISDGAGNSLIGGSFSGLGGTSITPDNKLTIRHRMTAIGKLTPQDYQNIYDEATALLTVGKNFRTQEIQMPAPDAHGQVYVITDALKNYEDFNDGQFFYKFCANYDAIDTHDYCPDEDSRGNPRANVRNDLIRARDLFRVLEEVGPASLELSDGSARTVGQAGVRETLREIAYIHLIFGNEFLVDAVDYRFSSDAFNAQQIILQEIEQLNKARQQYTFAVEQLVYAFNQSKFDGLDSLHVGDYFTGAEFELFAIASERMVTTLDELARRHRQLGQDETALAVYNDGITEQYIQAMALAQQAASLDVDFVENGGWQVMASLERLQAQVQTIHDGLNPFGFTDSYVPIHTYNELSGVVQNFLRDATEDEREAQTAQREFDHNASALRQELRTLHLNYDSQLLELCGATNDDFRTCEGGVMLQNYGNMFIASKQIDLIEQRIAQIPEKILIEQERAGKTIDITLQGGEALSALAYAIGVRNAYRVTKSIVDSTSHTWFFEIRNETSAGFSSVQGWFASSSVSVSTGYRHSRSKTTSVARVWDPAQEEVGRLNGLRDVQNAATQAEITGANSEAVIRNLLLQQADLMIELDIALEQWNKLADEHNHLVEKYHNLLKLRLEAQDDFLDSYLNNPAYRILRDSWTVEATRSHDQAAQFAYLAAKALEYEFLAPPHFLDDIFQARVADDVDNFMNQLEEWRIALSSPGERNRYPYLISLAEDILGLTDENLDPDNTLSASERAQLRHQRFQEFIQRNIDPDSGLLEFHFTTSIQDNNLFSPNVWNNRIAGIGLPSDVASTQGVALNLLTRQTGNAGTPEVLLVHGGQASYRQRTGDIVEYMPGPTHITGYSLPPGFSQPSTGAVILSSVNGNNRGSPTSALFNRSVAASNWTLRIDPTSPLNRDLDLTQLEDIEIQMDSTGIARPTRRQAAKAESQALIEVFERVKSE
ncbi:MAG: hypothetical protein AAF639_13880 [Chloroflexota bacterium]